MSFESKFRNLVGRSPSMTHPELLISLRELLVEFNKEQKIVIHRWHGESSFEHNFVGDKIIVVKYQKPEKDAEPREIRYEIDKNEYLQIKCLVEDLLKERERVSSREVAEYYYNREWNNIFSDRKVHNKFTLILNVLEREGLIEYRGGKIYDINK